MKFVVRNSVDGSVVWTEEDWPVVPRDSETVVIGGRELEVKDVDHDLKTREIIVWVRVPLVDLRDVLR